MKVDNLINEELKRFASINNYVGALEESMVGGLAGVNSGFMDDQGDSERLKTFRKRQMDMAEQEEGDELEEPIEDFQSIPSLLKSNAINIHKRPLPPIEALKSLPQLLWVLYDHLFLKNLIFF